MLRIIAGCTIAVAGLMFPLRLFAGGPPWLCLPLDGVTPGNVAACTEILTGKLEGKFLPQNGGIQLQQHAQQWYLTFYMGKPVALDEVVSALGGSGFSVPLDRLRLFGHVTLEIDCGKGTYVRALVRDIAEMLGACGHVSALRRTRVGIFSEAGAVTLEMLEQLSYEARHSEALLPVETALDDIPALAVTDEDAFRLKQGRSIVLVPRQVDLVKARLKPGSRTVSATSGGSVVALCEMRAGRLEPSRVFNL